MSVEIDEKRFTRLFAAGGNQNVLITLNIKGDSKAKSVPVLAHDMQRDAMTDRILHVDFLKIDMKEEIKTKVTIVLTGESQGVKLDGGILVQPMRQLEIKCLPADIPDKITVDVSALKINESIHVADIVPPKGVAILTPKDEAVAIVTMPTKEEEVAPAAAAVTAEGVPAEGAPAAEGAAAAGAAPAEADGKAKSAPAEGEAKAKAAPKEKK